MYQYVKGNSTHFKQLDWLALFIRSFDLHMNEMPWPAEAAVHLFCFGNRFSLWSSGGR